MKAQKMLDRSIITEGKPLILSTQCQFTIATSSDLAFDDYAAELSNSGIILLHLGFDDPEACIMKTIVENIGSIDFHDNDY